MGNSISTYYNGSNSLNIGNVGTIRSISFKIAPLTVDEPLIQLSATISISLVGGVVTLTGTTGDVYVDGVLNKTFAAKDFYSVSINFTTDITADNVVKFSGLTGHESFFAIFPDVLSVSEILSLRDM